MNDLRKNQHLSESPSWLRRIYAFRQLWLPKREGTHDSGEDCRKAYILRNLPIGIQNFEKLREGNFLYVDKTQQIYRLVSTGCYYFLSRPRRFGKSLLMSTIHSCFSGRKDLFEGLAIEKLEKEWLEHPVLHQDLNTRNYSDEKALTDELN